MGCTKHKILTDCDGVLLDWAAGFGVWARLMFGPPWAHPEVPAERYELTPNNADSWLRDAYGFAGGRRGEVFPAFQTSEFFGSLIAYPDASAWVPRIARDYAMEFVLVSSPGLDPQTLALRQKNLRNCFGDIFLPFSLLPALACKRPMLREHPPSLWFDDHVPHVLAGHETGHYAYHFDRFGEMNPAVPGRVSDWGAVHAMLGASPPHSWQVAAAAQDAA